MIQETGKCRRCVECADMSHHWLPNSDYCDDFEPTERSEFEYVCKHCGMLGRECHGCYGSGSEDNEHPETTDCCPECDGEGVICAA